MRAAQYDRQARTRPDLPFWPMLPLTGIEAASDRVHARTRARALLDLTRRDAL